MHSAALYRRLSANPVFEATSSKSPTRRKSGKEKSGIELGRDISRPQSPLLDRLITTHKALCVPLQKDIGIEHSKSEERLGSRGVRSSAKFEHRQPDEEQQPSDGHSDRSPLQPEKQFPEEERDFFPTVRLPKMESPPLSGRDHYEKTWKHYAKVILPHVGLVIMCSFYTLIGALVFYLVEGPNELRVRETRVKAINETKLSMLNELWDLAELEVNHQEWRNIAFTRLDNLTALLFGAFDDRYVTIEHLLDGKAPVPKWSFASSVFFAATTITTIGYGNLVPSTPAGRMICVLFGLLGVPLMLVTIADMGKFISDVIVYSYVRYYRLKKLIWYRSFQRKADEQKIRQDIQEEFVKMSLAGEDTKIPATLIMLIIIGYTSLGGVVLRLWEQEWSFWESFYFSFITMTTVGFGDYVPENRAYYLLTLIYILLGLAITTMCIDLAGTQYIKKIHYMGRKIKSAKDALRTMGEVMRYAAFLRGKYGLTDDELEQLSLIPDVNEWQEYLLYCQAFTPRDIHKFRYIDQYTDSMRESFHTSTIVTASGRGGPGPGLDDTSSLLGNNTLNSTPNRK